MTIDPQMLMQRSIAPWMMGLGPMPQIAPAQMGPPAAPLMAPGNGGPGGQMAGMGQLGSLLMLMQAARNKKENSPSMDMIPMLGSSLNPYGSQNLDPAGRILGGI